MTSSGKVNGEKFLSSEETLLLGVSQEAILFLVYDDDLQGVLEIKAVYLQDKTPN